MRLSEEYKKVIRDKFRQVFGEGEIFLFGSRVDDNDKGGDIDLYLVLKSHQDLFKKKIKFLAGIKKELGDQKIDVIFNTDSERLIEKEARRWGIKL